MLLVNATITVTLLFLLYMEEIKCNCGRRIVYLRQLIRNGFETSEGDWPWHTAIFHIGVNVDVAYKCGGTLISTSSVLTAAHCVFEFNRPIISERILVELGKYNLIISGSNSQQFQVYNVIPHPSYDTTNLSNDIAIIRLSTVATFNNFIQPICLWPSNLIDISEVVGKFGSLAGWGLTESDKLSYVLREAVMPVVSQTTCLESNRELFGNFLSNKTFCAGSRNDTNACQGDSGGGLVFESDGVFYIRGIVSLAKSEKNMSCNTNDYVLFTDVAQYLTWIVDVVPELSIQPFHTQFGKSDRTTTKDVFTLVNNKERKKIPQLQPLYNQELIPIQSSDETDYSLLPDEVICSKQASEGYEAKNYKIQGDRFWSFLVGIYKYYSYDTRLSFLCNGNLVSKRVVITVAHCFHAPNRQYLANEILLSLGQHNIYKRSGVTVKVQDIVIHPDYQFRGFDADLAVVIIQGRVQYTYDIQPICLWEGPYYEKKEKDEVISVGWAKESETAIKDEPEADVKPLVSEESCLRSNVVFQYITSQRTFCFGRRDGHEPCYVSGGAVLMDAKPNDKLMRLLRGLNAASLSYADRAFCDSTNYFVATDLAKFVDWIKYYIGYADDA